MKARESRNKVLLSVRVRAGATWSDACVVDMSPRGLGLRAAKPPERGSYVEVLSGADTIVARVAWSTPHQFGLITQDPLVMSALDGKSGPKVRPIARTPTAPAAGARRLGRAVEFTGIAVAAAATAILLFNVVGQTLSRPVSQVANILAQD